ATGSHIITDSEHRWKELRSASGKMALGMDIPLRELAAHLEQAEFSLAFRFEDVADQMCDPTFDNYRAVFREASRYLSKFGADEHERRPNFEANLGARFKRTHTAAKASIRRSGMSVTAGKITGLFPLAGIQDNTVNRLRLMSNSEKHRSSVPMGFRF